MFRYDETNMVRPSAKLGVSESIYASRAVPDLVMSQHLAHRIIWFSSTCKDQIKARAMAVRKN